MHFLLLLCILLHCLPITPSPAPQVLTMTAGLPWSLLAAVLVVAGVAGQQPPHILVLLADDLGFNDVSWHNEVLLRIESS